MVAFALLALLISLFSTQTVHGQDFYGHSVTYNPLQRRGDGSIPLSLVTRDNGRSSCSSQVSYSCEGQVCGTIDPGAAQQTDADDTGQNRWCQIEQKSTTELTAGAKSVSLSDTGCCWPTNTNNVQNWSALTRMDLALRSDTHSINHCPVSATVASLRVPQNCFTKLHLLAHDPDGDEVKCRLASTAPANIVLDENKCSLSPSGTVSVGTHVFEVMLEDFPVRNINVSYPDGTVKLLNVSEPDLEPLCIVKLLFTLQVLPSLPNCELGHVQPMFLSKTPSQDAVIFTSLGETLTIHAEAQANRNHIFDFQVSGPSNMSKVFQDNKHGKAEVTLSWTPQNADLHRHVPVCFTAETPETQSEMRCVVIVVSRSIITQGNATVMCRSNQMTVTLDRTSMPGIDVRFLMLLDKSCSLSANSTHIMGTMSFSTCGTKVEDKGDYIVFSNQINSFELPTEIITRRKKVRIDFSCQFPKFVSVSSFFSLRQDDYIFTESTFGSFGYNFDIFRDGDFTTRVQPSEYPVQVKLFQTIYMGISATSDLQEVVLFVESCRATPDDNADNPINYYLIRDGCKTDETVNVSSSSTDTTYNFGVQAFKFSGNFDQVYITCTVLLCEKDNPFSRCSQGCVANANQARRRRRRSLSKETVDHSITQGPFRFLDEDLQDDDDEDERLASLSSSDSANSKDLGLEVDKDMKTTDPVVTKEQDKKISEQTQATAPPPPPAVLIEEEYDIEIENKIIENNEDDSYRGIRDLLSSNITTAIFATAFLVSVVVMAILVRYFTRKKKEDTRMLLDTDEK